MSEKAASSSTAEFLLWEGERWASVPLRVFTDKELTPQARLLLAYLLTYANPHEQLVVFPSQKRMAEDLGITERRVRRYIKELDDTKRLKREKRVKVDPEFTGNPNACVYTITLGEPLGHERPNRPDTSVLTVRSLASAEQTKEQTTEQTGVVEDSKELESLELYASKTPGINNPKGWALSMYRKGKTAEQVVEEKRTKRKKRNVDPDSVESRDRYMLGVEA